MNAIRRVHAVHAMAVYHISDVRLNRQARVARSVFENRNSDRPLLGGKKWPRLSGLNTLR